MRPRARIGLLLVSGACAWAVAPSPALALNPIKPVCSVAGLVSGIIGKACSAVQNGGRLISAGKKLFSGHLGGAFKTAIGDTGHVASSATTALAVATIAAATVGGAGFAMHETARVLGETTAPQLRTTWFSSLYRRVAGIAAVLTLPFLFAAAVQSLFQSDLTLLLRATLGYLPLAMLAVGIAAPLTMLLLAASDQMSAIVSSAAGNASGHFLTRAAVALAGLTVLTGPFVSLLIGLIAIAGGLVLWIELLIREAAVYVVVLMLPLAFAALVWPARRVWAVRAVELLIALILSKFAIVAVLALGGAALSAGNPHGITGMLAGTVLLVMGAFAPWALLRLLPFTEIASAAAGSLTGSARLAGVAYHRADGAAREGHNWAARTADMRHEAEGAERRTAAAQRFAEGEKERMAAFQSTNGEAASGETQANGAPAPQANGMAAPQANGAPAPHANGAAVGEPVAAPGHERSSLGQPAPVYAAETPAANSGPAEPHPSQPPAEPHPTQPPAEQPPSSGQQSQNDDVPLLDLRLGPAEDHDPTPPAQPPEPDGGAL